MKKCPNCNQVFPDEKKFCLRDGAPLGPDTTPYGAGSFQSGEMPAQYYQAPQRSAPPSTANSGKWLYVVIGVLAAAVVVGGLFVVFQRFPPEGTNSEPSFETVRAQDSPANAVIPEQKKPANPVNSNAPSTPMPAVSARPAVSSSRVRFKKGAVTSTVFGSLSKGEGRNYLLACRAGQQMTATLFTSDRCVAFDNGSTTYRAITSKGDNTVAVTNTCSSSASYRVDITIL
jgi:hypothetical protein